MDATPRGGARDVAPPDYDMPNAMHDLAASVSDIQSRIGAALTSYLGVTAEDFTNLFWLVLICNMSSLLPLAGLGWLDEAEKEWEGEGEEVVGLKEGGSD